MSMPHVGQHLKLGSIVRYGMEYDGCEHEFESYSSEMIDRNILAIFYDCSFIARISDSASALYNNDQFQG
jgi:hypothetical protein